MLAACGSVLGSCDAAVNNLCTCEWIFSLCGIILPPSAPSLEPDSERKWENANREKNVNVLVIGSMWIKGT